MSLVKIGVLGCASIAQSYMIPAILNLKNQYVLSAIASRTEEKADEFGSLFGCKSYEGYESLLNEADIDAVYIPLPTALHAEWIEQALSRNIHVLVEKSLACDYEEVERLNRLALEKNLVLVENFQFRFHSQLAIIEKLLSGGIIGELRCVRSTFGFPPFSDADNIRYSKELGGGALLDAGAYPIKIAQIFLGQNIEVSASNLCYHNDLGVDIWGGASLRQVGGPIFAQVAFGFDNFYQCNLELWGSQGKIKTNRVFTAPPDFSPEIIVESSNGEEIIHVEPQNHFEKMLLHFSNLIETRNGLAAEYSQNVNQSRLIHETLKAACKR